MVYQPQSDQFGILSSSMNSDEAEELLLQKSPWRGFSLKNRGSSDSWHDQAGSTKANS